MSKKKNLCQAKHKFIYRILSWSNEEMVRFHNQGMWDRRLDWLITMLTTTIHNYYKHCLTMKKNDID